MTEALHFGVLGPFVVTAAGRPIDCGPVRQQAVLAALALRANEVVASEDLLKAVWGDVWPESGSRIIPTYVYRIRALLPDPGLIERRRDGYRLRLGEGHLDLEEFTRLVRLAEEASHPDQAAQRYARALSLFRGGVLGGLPGLEAEKTRLEELRIRVVADQVDIDLVRGRHTAVIPELSSLLALRPFDERLIGQLVRALFRAGRQSEAMAVYADARHRLLEAFGTEPGLELQKIHLAVLRHSDGAGRNELPYQDALFVGRNAQLGEIRAAVTATGRGAPAVVTISGMAGTGKTALAVHAARSLAGQYPAGQIFIDLHGHTPGREALTLEAVLDHLLTSTEISSRPLPRGTDQRLCLWRSEIALGRWLIILDNAGDGAVVNQIVPGSPTCAVLITSRRRLVSVQSTVHIDLGALDEHDAVDLLTQIVGVRRAQEQQAATRDLARSCAYLPLALRIAGARLRHRPSWTVADLAVRLADHTCRLAELSLDDRSVEGAFTASYEQLPSDQQRLLRHLGANPGRDVDIRAAAVLADLGVSSVEPLLEKLLDASLVEQAVPGRYRLHDLLREYAVTLLDTVDPPGTRAAARARLAEHLLVAMSTVMDQLAAQSYFVSARSTRSDLAPDLSGAEKASAWLTAEGRNVLAVSQDILGAGDDELGWRLALCSVWHLHLFGDLPERDRLLTAGLRAAKRGGSAEGEARFRYVLGRFTLVHGDVQESIDHLRQGYHGVDTGEEPGLAAQILAALVYSQTRHDPGTAWQPQLERALALAREADEPRSLAGVHTIYALLAGNDLDFDTALAHYREALDVKRELGVTGGLADILNGIAECELARGHYTDAVTAVDAARKAARHTGARYTETFSLCFLGTAYRHLGRIPEAVAAHRAAVRCAIENHSTNSEEIARLRLADSLMAAGETADGRSELIRILRSATDNGRTLTVTKALAGLAREAVARERPDEAKAFLHQALDAIGPAHHRRREQLQAQLAELAPGPG
ncbi:NB-ARC domain-containing protein [Allokutzneria sp. A3M-2-11 16]|uniref:AfsR/SARP family transcriptional regulator n=1 Tax=Allokutzneria sp. A3M-2-11 16 TaxID=2962043 RepID=UPI0020B77690|nr:BTAD domain-containing putative transcriptional regulator [Allokutzneria sp. A3M-2-11 16]MCP3803226.1 NB-ARC domain-containing protein [Allokutzneria sp. A3M-2-11 16]